MRVKYVHKSQLKYQKFLADGEACAKHFNEAEIHERALADPDAQPLAIEQLSKFRPADPFARMKKK